LSIIHYQTPHFSLKKTPFSLKPVKKLGNPASPIVSLQGATVLVPLSIIKPPLQPQKNAVQPQTGEKIR